jgi:hypothetical protein
MCNALVKTTLTIEVTTLAHPDLLHPSEWDWNVVAPAHDVRVLAAGVQRHNVVGWVHDPTHAE